MQGFTPIFVVIDLLGYKRLLSKLQLQLRPFQDYNLRNIEYEKDCLFLDKRTDVY